MIPDEEIAAMKDPSQGNSWADDARALKRLLAERELLVAEHESLGPDRKPAHDAVEAFK